MKKALLSFAFLSLSIAVFGQFCRNYKAVYQTIQPNGVRADLGPAGMLQDINIRSAFTPYYKDENTTPTIFTSNLWFIGKSGATRKLSVGFYTDYRFSAGPLDDATRGLNLDNCGKWNQYWTVRRADIEAHQRDFADNGRIDNPIKSIMAWPAVGNPNSLTINGFDLPRRIAGRAYAPFKDVDNDGIYDPMRGDFPAISTGNAPLPDLITWNVFNDFGAFQSLNFELQTTTYGYECADTAGVFNNMLFSSYKIINHGTTDLDSFKIGVFADLGLGCYLDQNIGCDSSLNTFFVYKKDSSRVVNNSVNCFGVPSFQGNIPVQSLIFLNQPMAGFRTFYGQTSTPALSDPQTASDFFNLFNGKWKDGTPVTRGGNGYNVGSTNFANYMFPSDPFDSSATAWSMARNPQAGFDLRTVGIADMNKIAAGETKTFDIAYSAHRRLGRNAWQNVATMREDVAQIRQFYQNPTTAALCTRLTLCDAADCVWPGDANKDGIANYKDLLPIGVAQGQTGAVRNGNASWSPRTVANWANTFPDGNFNAKHIDCNGDGVVTLTSDVATLKNNIQLTKPDFRRPNDVYTEGANLFMTFDRDPDNLVYSNLNNYNFTGIVKVLPTTDLFGLAFEVEYDPYFLKIVQPIDGNLPTTNLLSIIVDSSKLTDRKAQIECSRLGFTFQGTSDVAILKFKLGVNETNFNWPTNITFLKFKNIKGIKRDGTIIPLGGQTQRVRFTDILIANKEIENAKISIYPNPTTDETTVEWGKIAVKNLRLSNAMGQIVLEKQVETTAESIVLSLRDKPTGVYFLQIQTVENKTVVRKVILTR